ncbi:hypothetical protein ACFXA3_01420 [Streptomyces sp. NPDC059456]|uniref:hypothetical protein n=1 Tax=Streptomyces sp. NPDC059456 TaxID=3346838 RepID=UPI00367C7D43
MASWRALVHAVLTGRRLPSDWITGLWLGTGLAAGEPANSLGDGGRLLPAHPEAFMLLIAVVALLISWTGQFAEPRIRTHRGESLNRAMATGPIAPGLHSNCRSPGRRCPHQLC